MASEIAKRIARRLGEIPDGELVVIIDSELAPILRVVEAAKAWIQDRGQPDSPENYRPATARLMEAIIALDAKPDPKRGCNKCDGDGTVCADANLILCDCVWERLEKLEAKHD